MCGCEVFGVEDEEQGGEHTALGGISGGEAEVRELVTQTLWDLLVRKFRVHRTSWSSK